MKKFLKRLSVLVGFATIAVIIITVFIFWLERWHEEHDEITLCIWGEL